MKGGRWWRTRPGDKSLVKNRTAEGPTLSCLRQAGKNQRRKGEAPENRLAGRSVLHPPESADADIEMTRRKAFPAILRLRDRSYRNRLSKCSRRPLGLCGLRLPELNLIPIQVIDPGKATVGFIRSFGVNLYSLLF